MSEDHKKDDDSRQSRIDKAIHDIEDAEKRLEHIHEDEKAAEKDLEKAVHELKDAEREDKVTVHVTHVNEAEKTSFEERVEATLQQVWDKAYKKLEIAKKDTDIFQTGGEKPKSLMSFLNLTLKRAHKEKVIKDYHFEIASETGGA
ncbi:MAG: hypothetical protein HY242_01650 [Afipia sp.]|nr:hypothetical protein [Afipia sp.]